MKILFTATVQSHICQFHTELIQMLKEKGHIIHAAGRNNLGVKPGLSLKCVDASFDVPFERSPLKKSNIEAFKRMVKIIDENSYDVIHCNTPVGGVISRIAAMRKRKNGTKIIYTAHGFHFFRGAPIKNWLLYYPLEWLLSFVTDYLVCINSEDYALAKKHFHAKNIVYTKGVGFDEKRCVRTHSKEEARKILGIPEDAKVLFSIGELNKRKNHETTINALKKLNDKSIYWFVTGNGPLEDYLKKKVAEAGLDKNVVFVGYTRNITQYFEAADVFVFPSLQEGLPLALMEAMCFGVPIVASDIRGTRDLIEDKKGGYLLKPSDYEGFAEKIRYLLEHETVREEMISFNKKKVEGFKIDAILKKLGEIYKECEVK